MAPSHLQGLNLLHPQQQENNANANDLLAGTQSFPDLAAQLELWTNLAFDSEDGPSPPANGSALDSKYKLDDEEEDRSPTGSPELSREAAIRAGHANVVTGTPVSSLSTAPPPQNSQSSQMDLNALLAGFMGPNSNGGYPQFPGQQQQHHPTLSQLLALGPPGQPQQSSSSHSYQDRTNVAPSSPEDEPPAKRARVSSAASRKNSVSTTASSSPTITADTPSSKEDGPNAAEDKRRRNTAASARFRLKKKEREAALETRAKELETRVSELEKECEGLRRENGWLKGLVVGVTGAGAVSQPPSVNGPRN